MPSMNPPRPTNPISRELARSLEARIIRSVEEQDGCWIRTAAVNPKTGYTHVAVQRHGKRTYYYAHRIMYVVKKGLIPDGLTIDHLCERPACCNPKHLRAVTHRANVLRSKKNPTAINARRKKCVRGHRFELNSRGVRVCPECRHLEYLKRKGVGKR